jgi:hypothetical protein
MDLALSTHTVILPVSYNAHSCNRFDQCKDQLIQVILGDLRIPRVRSRLMLRKIGESGARLRELQLGIRERLLDWKLR